MHGTGESALDNGAIFSSLMVAVALILQTLHYDSSSKEDAIAVMHCLSARWIIVEGEPLQLHPGDTLVFDMRNCAHAGAANTGKTTWLAVHVGLHKAMSAKTSTAAGSR